MLGGAIVAKTGEAQRNKMSEDREMTRGEGLRLNLVLLLPNSWRDHF